MDKISAILSRIVLCLTCISAVSLIILMLLMAAVVVFRLWGGVIFGSYELIEFAAVMTVAFSIIYTTHSDDHVGVSFLLDRISERKQQFLKIISYILSIPTLGLICWAGIQVLVHRGRIEQTTLLKIPFFPFRTIWIVSMAFFCLLIIFHLVEAIRKWTR